MKYTLKKVKVIVSIIFSGVLMTGMPAKGEKPIPGKTYDKTNYQEVEEYCNLSLRENLESGDFIIKVGELNFSPKPSSEYIQASAANQGKYDVNERGNLITKKDQEPALQVYGDPFPKIDVKDPKTAYHIASNFFFGNYRNGSCYVVSQADSLGQKGVERSLINEQHYLYFQNRQDPVPNKDNFLECKLVNMLFPFDLRGNTTMTLTYNDDRDDKNIIYTPTLRRIVRTSPSQRSDPFADTDSCLDDTNGYGGKISTMNWKFLGDKELLVGLATTDQLKMAAKMEKGYKKSFVDNKMGYAVSGWKGAAYAPATSVFVIRPVWILEMMPIDSAYNYGKQILYVDKDTYVAWYKEIYDRQGEYWKSVTVFWSYQLADDGKDFQLIEFYSIVDPRKHHATISSIIEYKERPDAGTYRMPWNILNSDRFTNESLFQRSK